MAPFGVTYRVSMSGPQRRSEPRAEAPARSRPRALALASNLVLALLSGALALAASEAACRLWLDHSYRQQRMEWKSPLYELLAGSPREYRLLPGAHAVEVIPEAEPPYQWSYRINAWGFRGREISEAKPPGVRRVVFLGDSYTFGWGVDDPEVFPERISEILTAGQQHRLEGLNLGVPGYNTVQEAECLRSEAGRFGPDLVVLSYVMNDAEPQRTVPADPRILFRESRCWLLAALAERVATALSTARRDTPSDPDYGDYLATFDAHSRNGRASRDALAAIASWCAGRGIPLLVTILPDVTEPLDDSYSYRLIHRRVAGWCRELGVDVVDLLPTFEGASPKTVQVPIDAHPSARAHEMIAAALAGRIERTVYGPAR